jgi:Zn-dependent peptidase ImmA (M78 family)
VKSAKLRISANKDATPSPEQIVEAILKETGTAANPPTDEVRVLSYLNLEQMSFDFASEFDFVPSTRNFPEDLRAVLSVEDRLIATHSNLSPKRARFSVLHEVAHFVLPAHRDILLFPDTEETLSWRTKVRMEKEANQLAADLIFQGNRFSEEALDMPLSSSTVHELAPKYGASYEASIRRYVERHLLPCAVIVYKRASPHADDADPEEAEYRIQYTIASHSFKKKYFSSVESKEGFSRGSDIFQVHGFRDVSDVLRKELVVERGEGKPWHFESEIFTNGYKIFQLVLKETKRRR